MADVLASLPESADYDGENMCCSFLKCHGFEDIFAIGCEASNAKDGHVRVMFLLPSPFREVML
jgi:hypothetical protein